MMPIFGAFVVVQIEVSGATFREYQWSNYLNSLIIGWPGPWMVHTCFTDGSGLGGMCCVCTVCCAHGRTRFSCRVLHFPFNIGFLSLFYANENAHVDENYVPCCSNQLSIY